jgi:hypothetical protein
VSDRERAACSWSLGVDWRNWQASQWGFLFQVFSVAYFGWHLRNIFFCTLLLLFFFFWDNNLLYSPGWSQTHYLPTSAS